MGIVLLVADCSYAISLSPNYYSPEYPIFIVEPPLPEAEDAPQPSAQVKPVAPVTVCPDQSTVDCPLPVAPVIPSESVQSALEK